MATIPHIIYTLFITKLFRIKISKGKIKAILFRGLPLSGKYYASSNVSPLAVNEV